MLHFDDAARAADSAAHGDEPRGLMDNCRGILLQRAYSLPLRLDEYYTRRYIIAGNT